MKFKYCTLLIFNILLLNSLFAQDAISTTEQIVADIFEQLVAESDQTIDYETFYNDLFHYAENPINLNNTTRGDLLRLAFLAPSQVENILSYVYKNKGFKTIFELQLVEGIDMTDIRRLLPFVVLGKAIDVNNKIYFQDLIRYGKSEFIVRFDKGLETKEGYRFLPEEENDRVIVNSPKYLGNQIYHSSKYRYHYKDKVFAGFTCEKDAGEQFWGDLHKTYDYYSAYIQLNNIAKFKTLVLGDYHANFGQGLVLRQDYGMGKSAYVLNVTPRNSGLKKYSSTDEYNFFRGLGATLKLGKLDLTSFYSNKYIDADTLNGSFSSIYVTGTHRTLSEFNKKQTVNQQVFGSNLTLNFPNYQVGLTVVHTQLNIPLIFNKSVYNSFYFSGTDQTTSGLHYRLRWQKLNMFGETALTNNGALATLNGFSFSPMSKVNLVALHRYYSPEYDSFYATAFSEGSRVTNETGFYIGVEIRPFSKWKFSAYTDSYRFMWPKFGVDAPSIGTDYLFQTDYSVHSNLSMYWRCKYEAKEKNSPGSTTTFTEIIPYKKASMRYNLTYSFDNFSFKNVIESNLAQTDNFQWTYGILALQDLTYRFNKIPLKLDFRIQFFDAVDYDNRLYAYEKDIQYAFSIPMFYGKGNRYYLNVRYDLSSSLSLWFKIAQTVYADDRESLSTGNELILGNRKTDIRLMMKLDL